MIVIAILVTIVVSFLASWMIGMIGVSMNWPNAGAFFAVATMGAFVLYVMKRKDK